MLNYPNKSHRKPIKLPTNSEKLAEFMGIMAGDGGLNNPWQITISLNSEADAEYSEYVSLLIKDLFDLDTRFMRRDGKDLKIICSSAGLVDFLVEKGFTRGNKIKLKITIPDWVKGNKLFKKAFVRGLMDTDGCLYIHKHTVAGKYYQNIGLCFANKSLPLVTSFKKVLE